MGWKNPRSGDTGPEALRSTFASLERFLKNPVFESVEVGTGADPTYDQGNGVTTPAPTVAIPAYVELQVTLPSVASGAEISGSVTWASRSLCNLLRVEMTVDTECELMLLRKPVFDSTNRGKHKAFYGIGVGNRFMREGGCLFDYEDENGGSSLHYWLKNVGLSTTVPTLILNKRVPQ